MQANLNNGMGLYYLHELLNNQRELNYRLTIH